MMSVIRRVLEGRPAGLAVLPQKGKKTKMTISGFQKLTLLDYPGKTACIVFTRDCNFRCPFCHNADLVIQDGGEEIGEEEVFSYLEKRKRILDGVTITGGEPLLQRDLTPFIRRVKSLGYAVKLDTNGAYPQRLAALLDEGLLDYVAMDVKNAPEAYDKTAGVSVNLDRIRESVALLLSAGIPYEFRTTVAKGLHDEACIRGICEMIRGAERYYIQNFTDSGRLICGEGLAPFSKQELQRFAEIAAESVHEVSLRGID